MKRKVSIRRFYLFIYYCFSSFYPKVWEVFSNFWRCYNIFQRLNCQNKIHLHCKIFGLSENLIQSSTDTDNSFYMVPIMIVHQTPPMLMLHYKSRTAYCLFFFFLVKRRFIKTKLRSYSKNRTRPVKKQTIQISLKGFQNVHRRTMKNRNI